MVDTTDAMVSIYLPETVYRALIPSFRLDVGILRLETCFDMFHRSCNEGDGQACHDARKSVAERGERVGVREDGREVV